MAVFTHLQKDDVIDDIQELGDISSFLPVQGGTDNSVYSFQTSCGNKYIYKLYEGKVCNFTNRLLAIHKRIDNILTHKPLKIISNQFSDKVVIVFNYLNNKKEYNIQEILDYMKFFHISLNRDRVQITIDKEQYLELMIEETNLFINNIDSDGYISDYPEVDISSLIDLFKESLSFVSTNNEELHVGLIHNDLNKGNIIDSDKGIEFIDFDGVNKNLLLKDYIIFIIRFDIYDKIDEYFFKNPEGYYQIGNDLVSEELLFNLYKMYSIYLILNMIYYIGYDKKEVKESMYGGENQSWNKIFKNLQKNNIV